MKKLMEQFNTHKIVAIIRGVESIHMLSTAQALLAGGISIMEVTFNHTSQNGAAETLRSISLLKEKLGNQITLGAGTVLTPQQVVDAHQAGAEYMVSPNVDCNVIAKTKELGLLSMPGALTPSEIISAYFAGADIVKLFPVGNLGISYIRALRGSIGHIPLAAVGGVKPDNIVDFLEAGVICAGIGGNLIDVKHIQNGNFSAITIQAKRYIKCVEEYNHLKGY